MLVTYKQKPSGFGRDSRPNWQGRDSRPSGHGRDSRPGGCARQPIRVAALLALLFASTASAHADLRLCNTTAGRIGVAIGYKDASPAGWATEGWWNIAAHTCETIYKGTLSGRFYYVHAIDYDRGGEWAGQSMMCTADKSFTIKGVQDCKRRGFNPTGFFEVDTGENAKDWTIRLTDPGEAAKAR